MSTLSLSLSQTTPTVRLTRRGRLVVVMALTLLLFAIVSLGHAVADAGHQRGHLAVTHTWVVQPGENLWSIATSVAPGTDPRDTVARIVELNHLPSAAVTVGEALQVPA